MKKFARKLFGSDALLTVNGDPRWVQVHLDDPSSDLAQSRADLFDPAQFLDPDCPCCAPWFDTGGCVVHDGSSGKLAMRPAGGDAIESVHFFA